MKRFISYLYEYGHGRKIRNIGFAKVELMDSEGTIQIHGRGIRKIGGQNVRVYLCFEQRGRCMGIFQGELAHTEPAVDYRLVYTEKDTGGQKNYDNITGIILKMGEENTYAALWGDKMMNPESMTEWSEAQKVFPLENDETKEVAPVLEEETEEQGSKVSEPGGETAEDVREEAEESSGGAEEEVQEETNSPEENRENSEEQMMLETSESEEKIEEIPAETGSLKESGSIQEEDVSGEETHTEAQKETESLHEEVKPEETQHEEVTHDEEPHDQTADDKALHDEEPHDQMLHEMECREPEQEREETDLWVEKITREDIAKLPRCEWGNANNTFLLHGYRNYHHLLLIDDRGQLWLGVPGIYHEREQMAASACGFPRFWRINAEELNLPENERNDREDFGYWCRKVRGRRQ